MVPAYFFMITSTLLRPKDRSALAPTGGQLSVKNSNYSGRCHSEAHDDKNGTAKNIAHSALLHQQLVRSLDKLCRTAIAES